MLLTVGWGRTSLWSNRVFSLLIEHKVIGRLNMHANADTIIPESLPFLEAICWDLGNVHDLTLDEMLCRYERGWEYRGALADLDGQEKTFLAELARAKGSWLQVHV